MKNKVFDSLLERKQKGLKSLAVLIDPDKIGAVQQLLDVCMHQPPDLFLVGSSFKGDDSIVACLRTVRERMNVPVVLFPGNMNQVVPEADALLLLSVLSSRNADLLIGRHVEASYKIKQSGLEVIPTGYLLIESGKLTTVHYMSQSIPLPNNKPELAVATALAGVQLGMQCIYLEAGSGAENSVPASIIHAVSKNVDTLLFTGGGIITAHQMNDCYTAGTDVVVIGNALESNPGLFSELAAARDGFNNR